MKELTPQQIKAGLPKVKQWEKAAAKISRTYQFADFPAAMEFVNRVAELAEEMDHHPDIDVRWNKVTLTLTTHSASGLTKNDFTLAGRIDALV